MSKRASCRESVIGESPFEFNELVVHILCLICTSQVNGKANTMNVSRLRGVNRTFRGEIDTSLLLWRFMMRFTRRAMMEPPVHTRVNTVDEMKEFMILDSDEFVLREYLFVSGPREEIGWFIDVGDPLTFDYREMFIGVRLCPGITLEADYKCEKDINKHRGMIIRLNHLLGYGDVYRVRKK